MLDLPREAWWGGPSYYAKFSKAAASGWSDPSFFPIAVFLGKPEDAASLRSIGINTYMGAEYDGSQISVITGQGMSVMAQDEWAATEIGTDTLLRWYVLHVLFFPFVIVIFMAIHFWRVRKDGGISGPL